MMHNGEGHSMKCGCMHHKIIPGLITLFGLAFLLGRLGVISTDAVDMVWPILVIIGGLTKLNASRCTCC